MTLTAHSTFGLQELAAGPLPSLGGDPLLQPSWSRSLAELAAANQGLIHSSTGVSGGGGGVAPPQPTAAAQALLESSRTDFGALTASLEASARTRPTKPKPTFMTLQERCKQHRDGILERVLNTQRERTHRALEKAVERQLEDDWSKERQLWMEELVGKRNLVDSTNDSSPLAALGPSQSSPTYPTLAGAMTSNLLPGYASTSTNYLNLKMAEDHLQLVQSQSLVGAIDYRELMAKFQQLASSTAEESNAGYTTAWQLLSCMLPNLTTPVNGALGALIHLCRQYQTFIKNRVAAGSLARQDLSTSAAYGSGMARTVASYVKLDLGSGASFWPILYNCLRCGDAVAAKDVMNAGTATQDNFQEFAVIRDIITELARRQGNESCLWERGVIMIPSQALSTMVNFYQQARNLDSSNTYKVSVLALLSGSELPTSNTIEDYLFGRLWSALQSENPRVQIEGIGASIRKYGPEHFGGAEENGGWGYALPLLASQQFKTALIFLAEVGGSMGLLQAAHLGLVLSMKGIPLEDLGHSANSVDLPTLLLVKYAKTLETIQNFGVAASLVYLRRIPQEAVSQKEIASLICRSPHLIDQLAGTIKDDATRNPAELDKYLDQNQLSAVLIQAAESFRGQIQDRAKAEFALKLFMLAGQYDAVLAMLNDLITPTDVDDDTKRFWASQSNDFYSYYLSIRSNVLVSLENANKTDLMSINYTLMEMRHFFATLRQEKYHEAFEIVKRIDLLPLSQEELGAKEGAYKDLDPVLQREFPAFLSGFVHCLHGMHRKLKSEARGADESVEFHLRDLQKKARFLYIFAGLTNMPSATKEDIMRLRNNML